MARYIKEDLTKPSGVKQFLTMMLPTISRNNLV